MASGFDLAAPSYDSSFTHSPVGRLQRERVYHYLTPFLQASGPMDILELNAGTGEDARYMAGLGHRIVATDLSERMLDEARQKTKEGIEFFQLDINDLGNRSFSKKFDLIFSNFGGLNCISSIELTTLLKSAAGHLAKNGLFVAVIMPEKCLWERFYLGIKGKFREVFRRGTKEGLEVVVEGKKVHTWYYNPSELIRSSNEYFSQELLKPVAFAVPPSYLDAFFRNKTAMLNFLGWMDKKLFPLSWLAVYSDHYIVVLQKK